jgi:GH25 family lysozyme M1 (1,4-beta-N-acetylmuramidase)
MRGGRVRRFGCCDMKTVLWRRPYKQMENEEADYTDAVWQNSSSGPTSTFNNTFVIQQFHDHKITMEHKLHRG